MPTSSPTETLELTVELRLRRWARQNYVVPSSRLATWHPLILDEMKQRDAELAGLPAPARVILPLEMSFGVRIDAGHSLASTRTLAKAS